MPRSTSVLTRPLFAALALTAVGCGLAYALLGAPPLLGAEDAAIGFRYARNLAEGHGIVFNPGGERVEGFTSLSWLFVSAAAYRLFGVGGLEGALLLLSLALTVATLTMIVRLTERVADGAALGLASVWLVGLPGFYFWSGLSLMDVAPWAAGLTGLVVLVHRRLEGEGARPLVERVGLGALVVLLVLTRPESMLVVPGVVVVAALAYGPSRALRTLALEVVVVSVVSIGALTAFRLGYFGHPLPNTYYVKVSPDVVWRLRGGLTYLTELFAAHPISWLGVAAVAFSCGIRLRSARRHGWRTPTGSEALPAFAAGFVVLGVASVVYGGGDHYQGHRFLQPYLPLLAVPIADVVRRLDARFGTGSSRGRWLGWGLVVLLLAALPNEWSTYRDHGLRRQAIDVGLQGRFVGATLDAAFAGGPKPELGLWMVGGASYTYLGPVKDLLGLNWIAMGMSPGDRKGPRDHAAFNVDVFWSSPPEVMIPEPEAVLGPGRCVREVLGGALHGLLTSARFTDAFEPVRVRRGDGEPIIAYARSDWLVPPHPAVERLGWSYCNR